MEHFLASGVGNPIFEEQLDGLCADLHIEVPRTSEEKAAVFALLHDLPCFQKRAGAMKNCRWFSVIKPSKEWVCQ